jgi:hypothetical protein
MHMPSVDRCMPLEDFTDKQLPPCVALTSLGDRLLRRRVLAKALSPVLRSSGPASLPAGSSPRTHLAQHALGPLRALRRRVQAACKTTGAPRGTPAAAREGTCSCKPLGVRTVTTPLPLLSRHARSTLPQ